MTSPSPKIKVTIDGNEHELLMTYGLLTRLLRIVGNEEDAAAAGFSNTARDAIFAEVLNKRGKTGVIENFTKEQVEDLDITVEDATRLMAWVSEHLLDFFLGVAEGAQATQKKLEARAEALMPSKNGTPA